LAGQTVARREVIRLLGIASVAATFPGFRNWAFAGAADLAPVATGSYRPLFFNAADYRLVAQLAELIIPAAYANAASPRRSWFAEKFSRKSVRSKS